MKITLPLLAIAGLAQAQAIDLSNLAGFLKTTSQIAWPELKAISEAIHHDPELGLDERRAHDRIVGYFRTVPGWKTIPHAFDMETAFEMTFEHRPIGFDDHLPTMGFLAEYDALVGIGHACGHNHIALNGMATAILTSEALRKFDIPGRIKLVGCPDEENAAGKYTLNSRGAFDSSEIWIMAHPTSKSAVQPMNARLNYFAQFSGDTHYAAVRKAYQGLVTVSELQGKLPGTSSTVASIENVGAYATNIVQSFISLGVAGTTKARIKQTLDSLLDATYPGVAYVLNDDENGVGVNITGPGGHGSKASKGALILSIEMFKAFAQDSTLDFYLPGNTTYTELDITVDMRTRYTADIPAVAEAVNGAIQHLTNKISHDIKYPALELTPLLPETFVTLMGSKDYGLNDWVISDFAPASTDASWLQNPVLDPESHKVLGVDRVVFHANYNICGKENGDLCALNHEPNFAKVAGTEFSYQQTEIVARAEAHLAIELLADSDKYQSATSVIVRRN